MGFWKQFPESASNESRWFTKAQKATSVIATKALSIKAGVHQGLVLSRCLWLQGQMLETVTHKKLHLGTCYMLTTCFLQCPPEENWKMKSAGRKLDCSNGLRFNMGIKKVVYRELGPQTDGLVNDCFLVGNEKWPVFKFLGITSQEKEVLKRCELASNTMWSRWWKFFEELCSVKIPRRRTSKTVL